MEIAETLQLAGALYMLLVAGAACLNLHRLVLAYPGRALYASVRLALIAVTAGRVRLTPLARQTRQRQRRRINEARQSLGETGQRVRGLLSRGHDDEPPTRDTGWQ